MDGLCIDIKKQIYSYMRKKDQSAILRTCKTEYAIARSVFEKNRNYQKYTIRAIERGLVESVKYLLRIGQIKVTRELLADACYKGHAEIVNLLIADPDLDLSYISIIIDSVVFRNHVDVLDVLLKCPKIDPTKYGINLLLRAINYYKFGCLRLLLADKRILFDQEEIMDKVYLRGIEMVKMFLLSEKCEHTMVPASVFKRIITIDDTELMKYILSNDETINTDRLKMYVFDETCHNMSLEMMILILGYIWVDDESKNRAILKLMKNESIKRDRIIFLIDNTEHIDNKVLTTAINGNYVHIVKKIIDLATSYPQSIDVSANRNDALVKACRGSNIDIVRLILLDQRVNVKDRNSECFRKCNDVRIGDLLRSHNSYVV